MYKVLYRASDTRHGLFADLRKILEWSWLAKEVGNLDIELQYQKYDPEQSDVDAFVRDIRLNNPGYDPAVDGGRIQEKFYVELDPLRKLLGVELSQSNDDYDAVFEVDNARVSDWPGILRRVGLAQESPLWREIQNTTDAYHPTANNDHIRLQCHAQLKKLVSMRSETCRQIEAFYLDRLAEAEHLLGVHVRFAGHYVEAGFGSDAAFYRQIVADIDCWVTWVARNFSLQPVIFLATHLGELMDLAKAKWGDQLVSREIARSGSNQDYFFVDESLETQLEDAIIDCWLMSRCDALLGGVSNLAYTSMIINPRLPFFFLSSLANSRGG